jgi:hypothetical protein
MTLANLAKSFLLGFLVSLPVVAVGMEVEKSDATSLTVSGETETITIAGQPYFLWSVPVEKVGLEVFAVMPDESKGVGLRMTVGEPIAYDEAIKVLEVHYRNSAFDFDSLKLRNVTPTGIRYVAYCTTSVLCHKTFRAGNWVELESNGRNRLGGMTGFAKETYLITKIPPGAVHPSAETLDQYDGRLPRATSDELRTLLAGGVTVKANARSPEEFMTAVRTELEAGGFSVAPLGAVTGTLYTNARDLKLTSKTVDCGKKWGMGYIGDNRTETTVLIAVSNRDGAVNVQAAVGGVLRVSVPFGSGSADLTLTCKPTGVLEQDIATKIAARLVR